MSDFMTHLSKNIIMALCLMMFFVCCNHKDKNSGLLEYKGKFPDESAENITLTVSDFQYLSHRFHLYGLSGRNYRYLIY